MMVCSVAMDYENMSFLEVSDLRKSFVSPDGGQGLVVDVESFSLNEGGFCGMRGESGSGKTTFLHLLAGILRPDEGSVILNGTEVSKLNESARDHLRASAIGYVFQSFNLLQGFTCLENLMLAMSFAGQVNETRAKELLDRVGLSHRLSYYPHQLSIGQQQRVALARALANSPKLVLADEPTGNLDPDNAHKALALLRELCGHVGAALLLVSHDENVVSGFEKKLDWKDLNRAFSEVMND
jgi:putative ABC transport system ATP-binding protein